MSSYNNMDIINIVIIIILIILGVLYYIQFKFLSKTNNELTIIQKDNPDKNTIEEILQNKSPTIFTGMIETWEVDDDKNITKNEFDNNTSIFNIPLCIVKKYKTFIMPEGKKTNIIKEINTRHMMFLLEGELRLFLFNPEQSIEYNKIVSKYNLFDDPSKFEDIKYLEIKFSEGHIIYIPRGWSYCYKVEDYTELLSKTSESIFSLPHSQLFKI
jgi:hypothetical protein